MLQAEVDGGALTNVAVSPSGSSSFPTGLATMARLRGHYVLRATTPQLPHHNSPPPP